MIYIQKYGHHFKILLSCTLLFANEVNLTEFEHVSADGTFKKANNNRYNVIHKDDLEILLDYYENKSFDKERLSKLRRPASRFLLKENISNEEKIELLYDMKTQLTMSGQNTIPVNDIEARWMRNKEGISQISYNIQSAVDTTTKLICAVNVSQSPTDHYELPNIVKTTIENINKKPEKISTDTDYHNPISIEYLAKNNIQGLIPDRKQTLEIKKQTNTNPFHKDHFKYDYTNDTYICPQNQRLFFKYKYTYPSKDKNKPNKVERKYMNYDACKNCKSLHQCTKSSYRIINEFANENTLKMKEYMDTPEAQNEYKKRNSTVEAPFGTLKIFYEFNNLRTNRITQTENIMNLISTSYNLKRLYNIQNNILDEITEIDNFLEKLSTIFNLQLTATIK